VPPEIADSCSTVTCLIDLINASAASTTTKNSLKTTLNSAKAYLAIGTPTMKAAACQQLKLFKSSVTTAMNTDPAVAANGALWKSIADTIRAGIPCVAPN
jgi:hypothetical protein